jgi:hypothetical protein
MSTVYTRTRTPDVLPGMVDLLILRNEICWMRREWERKANAIGRVMKFA